MQSNTRTNNLFQNLKEEPSIPYLKRRPKLGQRRTPKMVFKL